MRWRRVPPALPWVALVVVLVGAAQQAAVALGVLTIGDVPGADARGRYALTLALLVLFLLGPALLIAAITGHRYRAAPALALAAALLLVAHFYAFDAYYAPTERRMSDGGSVAGTWIVVVVACDSAAGLAAVRWHRAGLAGVAITCWLVFGTAVAAGLGH